MVRPNWQKTWLAEPKDSDRLKQNQEAEPGSPEASSTTRLSISTGKKPNTHHTSWRAWLETQNEDLKTGTGLPLASSALIPNSSSTSLPARTVFRAPNRRCGYSKSGRDEASIGGVQLTTPYYLDLLI